MKTQAVPWSFSSESCLVISVRSSVNASHIFLLPLFSCRLWILRSIRSHHLHKNNPNLISQLPIMTANTSHPPHLNKFPLVLHTMLEDAEVKGFEHVVSWLPNSNMFKIHNSAKFTQDILKHYFPNQTFYKSFLRQLNIYDFDRINSGHLRGAYFHASFVRGGRDLPKSLLMMERVRVNTSRQASYSHDSCGSFITQPYEQGDDKTAPSTPTTMKNSFVHCCRCRIAKSRLQI
jgi:hypothetical protein